MSDPRRHTSGAEPPFSDARLVVVDDEPANVSLLERLLELWGYRNTVGTTDSAQALRLCAELQPDLLLLDLRMPSPDGFAVMERLGRLIDGPLGLPVLALTADQSSHTRHRALQAGARDFVGKPFDQLELRLRIANLLEVRRAQLELRRHNQALEAEVRARTAELDEARLETLARLALAAEYRDDETHEHTQRVGRTAALIARRLGWDEDAVERIRRAAPLHDIGKIGIPDAILLKPGPLSPGERGAMKAHATIGAQILSGSRSDVLVMGEQIALSHHERWDGGGYPQGRGGEDIPIGARIVHVADVFDALAHRRPYKEPWPPAAAAAEISRGSAAQFDPRVVAAFEPLDPHALAAPMGAPGADGAGPRRGRRTPSPPAGG